MTEFLYEHKICPADNLVQTSLWIYFRFYSYRNCHSFFLVIGPWYVCNHEKQSIFSLYECLEGKFKEFGLSNYAAWEVVSVNVVVIYNKCCKLWKSTGPNCTKGGYSSLSSRNLYLVYN